MLVRTIITCSDLGCTNEYKIDGFYYYTGAILDLEEDGWLVKMSDRGSDAFCDDCRHKYEGEESRSDAHDNGSAMQPVR